MGRLMPLNLIWQDFLKIDPTGKTKEQIEEEKLYIIVERATYFNRDMTADTKTIVHNRKQMVVDGTGDYFGAPFSMPQYDLNYEPAFEKNFKEDYILEGINKKWLKFRFDILEIIAVAAHQIIQEFGWNYKYFVKKLILQQILFVQVVRH